jgi:hypothetical protein
MFERIKNGYCKPCDGMSTKDIEAMNLKSWVKKQIRFIRGDHLDEMLAGLKKETSQTKRRVDEIYHLTLDGENDWLRREECNDRK